LKKNEDLSDKVAELNSNNQAMNGTVLQYGSNKTRTTTIMAEVKGRWK
jgi:hypothetical protein